MGIGCLFMVEVLIFGITGIKSCLVGLFTCVVWITWGVAYWFGFCLGV